MILQVVIQTHIFIFLVNNVNELTKVGKWPLITLQSPLSPTYIEYEINQRKFKKYLPDFLTFLNSVTAFE